jgi:hypothetical protein
MFEYRVMCWFHWQVGPSFLLMSELCQDTTETKKDIAINLKIPRVVLIYEKNLFRLKLFVQLFWIVFTQQSLLYL